MEMKTSGVLAGIGGMLCMPELLLDNPSALLGDLFSVGLLIAGVLFVVAGGVLSFVEQR